MPGIKAPKRGHVLKDISGAGQSFVAGLNEREKLRREEARKDRLAKAQEQAAKHKQKHDDEAAEHKQAEEQRAGEMHLLELAKKAAEITQIGKPREPTDLDRAKLLDLESGQEEREKEEKERPLRTSIKGAVRSIASGEQRKGLDDVAIQRVLSESLEVKHPDITSDRIREILFQEIDEAKRVFPDTKENDPAEMRRVLNEINDAIETLSDPLALRDLGLEKEEAQAQIAELQEQRRRILQRLVGGGENNAVDDAVDRYFDEQ